jgi:hypothetical protein
LILKVSASCKKTRATAQSLPIVRCKLIFPVFLPEFLLSELVSYSPFLFLFAVFSFSFPVHAGVSRVYNLPVAMDDPFIGRAKSIVLGMLQTLWLFGKFLKNQHYLTKIGEQTPVVDVVEAKFALLYPNFLK